MSFLPDISQKTTIYETLLLKRVALWVSADHPSEGVDEEQLLCGIDEALVAMSHIEVYHPVFLVGPHDWKIAEFHHIFQPEGIHFW